MADEKKPGFFRRLFGFGKGAEPAPAPEPAQTPPPPADTIVESPPIRDEAAGRIAAEIAEARRQAAVAEAEARRQAEEADRLARVAVELEAAADVARVEAARKAEQERLAAEMAEAERRAAEDAARKAEQERLARAKAEAERKKAEAERNAAEEASVREQAARKAEQERLAHERADAERRAAAEVARAEAERQAREKAEADRAAAAAAQPRQSWWQKLKSGLSRTAGNVTEGITSLFTKRKLDDETLEELEDLLIQADLGVDVAARISAAVGKGRYDKEIAPEEVKAILADEVAKVLKPVALPLAIAPKQPFVLLMVGVNGSGKTTTIGKLAAKFRAGGKKVMLAAGDTFRAAAIEQLKVWGERTGAPVIARDQGGDAAGLAFDAVKAAQESGADVLLIDTAGRLQNRTELMAELEKVIRVIRKLDATAPHATLLVLDATVGQNALSQVDIFGKQAGVTGLVMTKLDGTARGGILVALADKFKLPIHFIGVGEGVDDLEPFEAIDFARAIAGLEQFGR
jgi:fused signal recognition particle receptor